MSIPYLTPEAWASGPDRVYAALSKAVVTEHAAALKGRRVLDLGAGTGSTSRALLAVGSHPVALDMSWSMLAHRRARRPPAVVADATRLPMTDDAVGATVAAFVLSHSVDPVAILREVGRVTTPGGAVVAVSFAATGARSAAHGVVEAILRDRGWVAPSWFCRMKEELEPAVADPDRVLAMAAASGLEAPVVTIRTVDTEVDGPDELVAWRLGSPGVAPFVDALPAGERTALCAQAVAALGPQLQPLVLDLLVLSSRAAGTPRSAGG